MVRRGTVSLGLGIVLAAGGAIVAAPAQDRPGFPTQARVWIENRDPAEAVPVTVIRTPTETPWHVQIVGVPTVALSSASVLPTTRVRGNIALSSSTQVQIRSRHWLASDRMVGKRPGLSCPLRTER
jgi:hypothetical protein